MRRYYYLYRITNKLNNKIYVGVHSSNKLKDRYMGSGTRIKIAIKNEGRANFTKEILEIFNTKEEMLQREREIVNKDFIAREDTYNIILGGGYNTSGIITVRDINGNTQAMSLSDPRYLSGEFICNSKGLNKNKLVLKDLNGNIFRVSRNDPRYLSGELIHLAKGLIIVKDFNDNSYMVSKYDPRYLSGELIPINKNRVTVKDKDGKTLQVSNDDPRYLNGELISVNIGRPGKIRTKDINNNIFIVSQSDERYLSGELIRITRSERQSIKRKKMKG